MADRQLENSWIFHHELRSSGGRLVRSMPIRPSPPWNEPQDCFNSPLPPPTGAPRRPKEFADGCLAPGFRRVGRVRRPISLRKAACPQERRERSVPTG